jgi:hypothetical protein
MSLESAVREYWEPEVHVRSIVQQFIRFQYKLCEEYHMLSCSFRYNSADCRGNNSKLIMPRGMIYIAQVLKNLKKYKNLSVKIWVQNTIIESNRTVDKLSCNMCHWACNIIIKQVSNCMRFEILTAVKMLMFFFWL